VAAFHFLGHQMTGQFLFPFHRSVKKLYFPKFWPSLQQDQHPKVARRFGRLVVKGSIFYDINLIEKRGEVLKVTVRDIDKAFFGGVFVNGWLLYNVNLIKSAGKAEKNPSATLYL
jgi:hypothetical protein